MNVFVITSFFLPLIQDTSTKKEHLSKLNAGRGRQGHISRCSGFLYTHNIWKTIRVQKACYFILNVIYMLNKGRPQTAQSGTKNPGLSKTQVGCGGAK